MSPLAPDALPSDDEIDTEPPWSRCAPSAADEHRTTRTRRSNASCEFKHAPSLPELPETDTAPPLDAGPVLEPALT